MSMGTNASLTPSDISAIVNGGRGNNGDCFGFGGGSAWWIIILMLFGWGGNWRNNGGGG